MFSFLQSRNSPHFMEFEVRCRIHENPPRVRIQWADQSFHVPILGVAEPF